MWWEKGHGKERGREGGKKGVREGGKEGGREEGEGERRKGGKGGRREGGLHLVLLPVHQHNNLRLDSLHKFLVLSVVNMGREGDGLHAVREEGMEGGGREGGRGGGMHE